MGNEFPTGCLGDVATVRSGFAFKSKDMGSTGVPIIKIKNVTPPTIDIVDVQRVPREAIAGNLRIGKFLLDQGDILIAMTGATVGKVGRMPQTFEHFYLNQRVGKVFLDRPEAADYNFLYYVLSQESHVRQMFGIAHGSAQANISGSLIEALKLPLPPVPLQRHIAHILGALDEKIDLNRRMNRTLEKMAAAIFKSWFIDFDPTLAKAEGRDPGLPQQIADLFPDSFEDSELGPIPTGWEVGALGDIANSPRRGIKPAEVPPATPYIGLQDMPRRCIALDTWGRADEVGSQKSQFNTGEILFGKLRPYFHKVGMAPVDGVCSTDILVVVPKDDHWHSYVLSLVSSKEFVDYTDSHSAGTKMPRTNWKDMSRYPLAIPPDDLAQAFQGHVASFHNRITTAVRQNRRLAALRDTLLPMLLSGELDVSELPLAEEVLDGN